jgi:uncharacterized membrane protein (DUF441 family)
MNRFQIGLLLLALSCVFNVDGIIALGESDPPPAGVSVGSVLVALATLAGVLLAWRGRQGGTVLAVAGRLVSALVLGIPAYFIGAPAWVYVMEAAGIALTVAGLAALWTARRAEAPA